jgi:hypothetical protein
VGISNRVYGAEFVTIKLTFRPVYHYRFRKVGSKTAVEQMMIAALVTQMLIVILKHGWVACLHIIRPEDRDQSHHILCRPTRVIKHILCGMPGKARIGIDCIMGKHGNICISVTHNPFPGRAVLIQVHIAGLNAVLAQPPHVIQHLV